MQSLNKYILELDKVLLFLYNTIYPYVRIKLLRDLM